MTVTNDDLRRWVDAGLIDAAAAEHILAFEEERAAAQRRAAERPGVGELLVYLAAAVTAAGFVVLAATNWEQLNSAARVAIPGLSAIALIVAGLLLRRSGNNALMRAASMAWLVGEALIWGTVAIAASEVGWSEDGIALATGVVAMASSLIVWWLMPSHPQIVGIGGAAFFFSIGIAVQTSDTWTVAVLGLCLAIVGLCALITVERGTFVPQPSARVLAVAGLVAGAVFAGLPPSPPFTELLAAAVVVLLIAAGVRFGSLLYVGAGVFVAFVGLVKLILRHVDSPTIAGLALVAIGVLLLLVIGAIYRVRPWTQPRAQDDVASGRPSAFM